MFQIKWQDTKSRARIGQFKLNNGIVETPVFIPVGTKAAVKTLSVDDLNEIRAQIILSNTYHLNYRPGLDVIKAHQGLHPFMRWENPILTDSGGFQVFSLAKHIKLSDKGVEFRYPETGELSFFTPEKVVEIQRILKSDIVMVFDQPVAYPAERGLVLEALERTTKWASISKKQPLNEGQKMFGIMQGAFIKELRQRSAEELISIDFDGYAIGGLSVGEPRDLLFEILDYSTDMLPTDKPRYLMGVGDPIGLIKGIQMGVDMFDSVLPTRLARNGSIFTSEGRINLKNSIYRLDTLPLDQKCQCKVCLKYSRSYLRHIYMSQEILAHHLLSWHNLYYLTDLVEKAKLLIQEGNIKTLEKELKGFYE